MEQKELELLSKVYKTKKPEEISKIYAELEKNPMVKKVKETLAMTTAEAIIKITDWVKEAAKPNLVGREILEVVNADSFGVKVPKAALGTATEGAFPLDFSALDDQGEVDTYDSVTIDREIGNRQLWDPKVLQDLPFDYIGRQNAELGRSIAEKETALILTELDGIAAADLATGAEISLAATMTWANMVSMVSAVRRENFNPTHFVMSEVDFADVEKMEEFKSNLYANISKTGVKGFASESLGVIILHTTKATAGTVYCVDKAQWGELILRNDMEIESFERTDIRREGVRGSEVYKLHTSRKKAVCRGKKPT